MITTSLLQVVRVIQARDEVIVEGRHACMLVVSPKKKNKNKKPANDAQFSDIFVIAVVLMMFSAASAEKSVNVRHNLDSDRSSIVFLPPTSPPARYRFVFFARHTLCYYRHARIVHAIP